MKERGRAREQVSRMIILMVVLLLPTQVLPEVFPTDLGFSQTKVTLNVALPKVKSEIKVDVLFFLK